MSSQQFPSASLLIILDALNPNDFNQATFLLHIFHKKLSDLEIQLDKIFLINKSELDDIKNHLNSLKTCKSTYHILTTTTGSNTQLLLDLVHELKLIQTCQQIDDFQIFKSSTDTNNHCSLLHDSKIYMINQNSFHFNLFLCLKSLIQQSKNVKISFKNDAEINDFLNRLNQKFDTNLKKEHLLTKLNTERFSIQNLHSNYFPLSIEFVSNDANLTWLKNESFHFKRVFNLCDNYVNADFYLYEFDLCVRYLRQLSDSESDLEFLSNKIDLSMFVKKVKESLGVIEEALKKNTIDEICVSFNGGKDCCVVLYLYYAVVSRLASKFPISLVFIKIKNEFEEMSFFIDEVLSRFYKSSLKFIVFEDTNKSMKECLRELKETHPKIGNILMGTRRADGDYFKNMQAFAPTDSDWPRFMRVNPILDWSFSEVWFFIRLLRLPYCSLYDQGYTSIDNTLNTVRNRELLCADGLTYLPAYLLRNESTERCSRRK